MIRRAWRAWSETPFGDAATAERVPMTVTEPHPTADTADRHPLVLRVSGLTVDFVQRSATVYAVRGVDLQVRRGETLVLLGESGAGKSITGRAVMGLLPSEAKTSADAVE